MKLVVNFDGGSRGNGTAAQQGYGSYRVSDGTRSRIARLEHGPCTNNAAEYLTAIVALREIRENLERAGIDTHAVDIEMRGDSQLVINQVNGAWKIKNDQIANLVDRASNATQDFNNVTWVWVPREESVRVLGH